VAELWPVRLAAAAELDFADILRWTTQRFGAQQAQAYRDILLAAVLDLRDGPDLPGSRSREDLAGGLRALHVARHGRRARHYLFYRVVGERVIEIIRILHEGMDPKRHIQSGN
jgi:toxin ParE1/3/4